MEFSNWETTGKYFLYKEKYKIFYQERGEGETLLLLHGFPTASWDWHKVWPKLIDRYHVLALDFIGFGYSAKPKRYHYSIHDQVDLIEHFLEIKGIQKLHILAHDYGDTVLQELLARFIKRREERSQKREVRQIQSIVLLNGGLFPETHKALPIQKALISPLGILLTPFLSKKKLSKNFHNIFGKNTPPTATEIDEFYTLMSRNRGKYIFHKLIRYMADRIQHRERWVSALQQSPVPIRLINGGADPISGKHIADRYRELIPNPDVILLKEIGHYPQTEAPDLVLEHYFNFRKKA